MMLRGAQVPLEVVMQRAVASVLVMVFCLTMALDGHALDQSRRQVKAATSAFKDNEPESFRRNIVRALDEATGPGRVMKLFKKYPAARTMLVDAQLAHIDAASTVFDLLNAEDAVTQILNGKVLEAADGAALQARLQDRAARGNRDGTLRFMLDAYSARWPVLAQPDHQRLIVERTLAELQVGMDRPVEGLMAYARGASAEEKGRILDLLPKLRLRAAELPLVDAVYPGYSMAYRMTITTRAALTTTNADRLFEMDLLAHLRARVRGVSWLDAPVEGALTVNVERVRYDERQTPEQTQTITYAQHQVNLMGAVLLMPRDASYLFDQVTSGAAIDYGYVVTVTENGAKVHEEIVRGTATQNAVRCQNARIVNVFGGVQPANFVANPDMQQRCGGSQTPVSLDQIRGQVMDRILDGVIKAAPIARVHSLN